MYLFVTVLSFWKFCVTFLPFILTLKPLR